MKVYQKPRYHEWRWKTHIEPLVDKDGKDRRMLDLGCNAGFYMRKLEKYGYQTIGVEKDDEYIQQAPKDLNIIKADVNYFKPPVSYLTLLACVHYHQTDEQVEALFHNLMYSALNLIVMGRHKGRVTSRPDRRHLLSKMKGWKVKDTIQSEKFYSVLFENTRYQEFDIDELYERTKAFTKTLAGFDDFVPAFEQLLRGDDKDFIDYLKRRKLRYPLGRCWLYKILMQDIKENGLNQALQVKDGRISDGYHRLIILRELGIRRVVCRIQR